MTEKNTDAVFVDFLIEGVQVYVEVTDFAKLRDYLIAKLEEYNNQPKTQKMDIVLFREAIIHLTRIYRVINMKRGHALLVGVGGSGRHSLTRLCAFISNMNVEQLEIRKDFDLKAFRQKLRDMHELATYRAKGEKFSTVFIFSDNDIIEESFLEDVQNLLSSGNVPNLYTKDDLENRVIGEMRKIYKREGGTDETQAVMTDWFFNKVKNNLHMSICMSPIGSDFLNYCKLYPALINNTTIDWFMQWPEEALIEVA